MVCDSRSAQLVDIATIRRRRRCTCCDHRFNTYELRENVIAAIEQRLEAIDTLRAIARKPVSLVPALQHRGTQ